MIKLLILLTVTTFCFGTGSLSLVEVSGICDKFEISYTMNSPVYAFFLTAYCDKEKSASDAKCTYYAYYAEDSGAGYVVSSAN